MDGHQHSLSGESSASSAIDIPGTPVRIGSAGPSSPALTPSESRGSFARRRTSWGRVEISEDPLRFDLSSPTDAEPLTSTPRQGHGGWVASEDPFSSSPLDEDSPIEYPFRSAAMHTGTYTTSQPGPSSASLIPSDDVFTSESQREDDEAHLTSNMSRIGNNGGWSQYGDDEDPERSATTARSRRKNVRYSTSPRSLKKTGTRIMTMSRNLRRASLRVVNLAGMGLDDHVRLGEGVDRLDNADEEMEEEDNDEPMMDLTTHLPLRGRTLSCMGPTNKVRLAMFRLLVFPWTEPTILLLIILNAVVLTIQAAHSQALPADGSENPPSIRGYFYTWEDYTLFVLFVLFTLECFARIAVSGFILDPEIPVSSLLSAISTSPPEVPIPHSSSIDPHVSLARHPSVGHSSHRRGEDGLTVADRFRQLRANLLRPFALSHQLPPPNATTSKTTRRRSDTAQSQTPMMEKIANVHSRIRHPVQPTVFSTAFKSDNDDILSLPFRLSVQRSHEVTRRNLPFLRQSWLRVDFVAVVSFWICFALAMTGAERGTYHIGIFRALSVLRTARLLAITSGTTTIMRSLKTARPLLASVAYFVLFAMILFSIIGIQSFKGSFRRSCRLSPTLGSDVVVLGNACGAYIDPVTLEAQGYLTRAGSHGPVKGYVCPLGQTCEEDEQNPNAGIASFDTIYFAALQVFIVSSANGWSPLMYQMMDAEYYVSCFFFIVCIVVLNFWLINLFVAVITNTFSAIRKDTSRSAFGAAPLDPQLDNEDGWAVVDGKRILRNNRVKEVYENIRWCWVALALASLVLQATRDVDISPMHEDVLDKGELVLTIVFDVEIFIRIIAHLPDWRSFFYRGQNWLDLTLAIGSTVIQIPAIHNSSVYPWLTILQLARFYRVILEIPRMKPLLMAVFGNMYGLANMSLFLILINFLTALVAVQLLRGDVDKGNFIDFGEVFNSFLAIYQVFSSENWTDVLYGAAQPEVPLRQSAIVILFISGWMFFANFIVLQMFIAVINENFDVAEESKRSRQAKHYWASHRPEQARAPWIQRLNPYRWFPAKPKAVAVEQLPSNLVLPMQKTLIQDYDMPQKEGKPAKENKKSGAGHYSTKSLQILQTLFSGETARSKDVPLTTIRNNNKRESLNPADHIDEETERHLDVLAALNTEASTTEEIDDVMYERRAQKADFIREHPTYDKTFWLFSQKNPIRHLCQKLVPPANNDRIYGTPPHPIAHLIVQLLLLLTVIGGIVVEIIATPIYRRNFYQQHGFTRSSWFDHAEMSFGLCLLLEFLIKVVADGFVFTPNAYVRSIWNILDFLILIGILINVSTGLLFVGGLSRVTRSLKALRVLRLITLIEKMRSTFESLIISGASRILDAALLAILYMIPYAVWGLNIFAGLMNECNDSSDSISNITTCINEYPSAILGPNSDEFGYLIPRVWANPAPSTTFSFDSFRSSLLILFEIVSLEGWVDVMSVAVSIVGAGDQPQTNVSQVNAIFFLIYNLLGGVVILTLFVSIIIGNFTAKTGTALLTQPQREWIDLQKLIKRQRPSKRPMQRPTWPVRAWCYDRAMHKHGWWYRMMTWLFVIHVVALMTQTFTTEVIFDELRNDFFIFVTAVYMVDILVRLYGLGWHSYSANGWNSFDIFVAGGSLLTTVVVRVHAGGFAIQQLQKLFLTTMAFKLVQRTNSLNKLFKTAVASLPVIFSLLGLWLILFMFFAILFVEVFSMTKWNTAETRNQNYSTTANALVMLAFMTTGEGWNQYMHDFAIVYPRCTNSSPESPDSDCGSVGWSFTLFIAWNLLSMYIFTNLFTGVVVESFYYVFQMTGGAKSITREEIRGFKKVWAELANPRTGYLERDNFVKFFSRLPGIFEVRIYPVEYSIPRVVARSTATAEDRQLWPGRIFYGINLDVLNANLANVDHVKIKQRKELYNRLFHEARISYEPGKGISFTNMLLLLAHHKLIVDTEALVLKDLVVRNETTKLVKDLVDFDRVQSLLLMISHRRRYVARREQMRVQKMQLQGVPAIVVQSSPVTPPPPSTRDITSPGTAMYRNIEDSPSPRPATLHSPEMNFSLDSPSGTNLHRSRRISDASMLSTDIAVKASFESSRDSRYGDDEPTPSIHNSLWRDMMQEAEEEEE